MKATVQQIKDLKDNSKLFWVSKNGENIEKLVAIKKKAIFDSILLLLTKENEEKVSIRWSLITNQPVGQSRGHIGTVWLELDE